ncbi:MAG: DUF1343 domain-containing protein [Bacteroidales bacterium]|nr:DUF1343 domain-containing protein [Bacteroidales bacterium]
MKKILTLVLLALACTSLQAQIRIMTGIEVLKDQNFKCLEGKRVGLITNPTGVDNHMVSDIDILAAAPNVNLVALYGPEHGVRGNAHAGDAVSDEKDAATGLPVYSLYGKTRKATPEMLKDIDVLVYDIQDIGCRSFTYISSMGLAMEAAAENGKEFIVLDRPNPLGGLKVEGNLAEDDCISFVSQFKIPYIYGLTCGELANLINEEGMLKNGVKCKLSVVKMKGWKRKMDYVQTGLQWIPSSPHVPHTNSPFFYPVSGILGEFGYVSIGVGYTIPFQMFAAPWIKADEMADAMNALKLPGVIFRPIYAKPFYSVFSGQQIEGVQVHITNVQKAPLSPINFLFMQEMARLYPDHKVFEQADKGRYNMFDIVCGSKNIRKNFSMNHRWSDIEAYWNKDVKEFKELSTKYYLYK